MRIFDVNFRSTERVSTSTGVLSGAAALGAPIAGGNPRAEDLANVSSSTKVDPAELRRGFQTLLSGRASLNVDQQAGLLQILDFPERLDRVGALGLGTLGPSPPRRMTPA